MTTTAFTAPPPIERSERLELARAVGRLALRGAVGRPSDTDVIAVAQRLRGRSGAAAEAFARWAEREGVSALVAPWMRAIGAPGDLTADLLDRLDDTAARVAARAAALAEDRSRLSAALASAAVPWRPIKGAWLADHAYASPALRPMADTDVVVPAGLGAAADRAITSLGYVRAVATWKHDVYRRPGDAVVDPRGEHAANPRPVEVHRTWGEGFRGLQLDVGARAAARTAAETGDDGAGWPDMAAMLIHVAAHATVDAIGRRLRLLSLVDVAVVAESLGEADWRAVRHDTADAAAARFVWPSLALAERELGARLPEGLVDDLAASVRPALRAWLDGVDVDGLGRHSAAATRRAFLEVPRIWPIDATERRTVWRWILWPPRAALADRYPRLAGSRLWPLAYARHAAYTVRVAARRARRGWVG